MLEGINFRGIKVFKFKDNSNQHKLNNYDLFNLNNFHMINGSQCKTLN